MYEMKRRIEFTKEIKVISIRRCF